MFNCRYRWLFRCILLLVSLPGLAAGASDVRALATSGNPASMVVWGNAEAIAMLADGTVLAARAQVGDGRIVTLGHGGFLSDDRADTPAFIAAQVGWLARGGEARRAWGVPAVIRERLAAEGVELAVVSGNAADLDLSAVDLIVGSPQAFARAGRLDDLAGWLHRGGSMLSVETAWGQLQLGHAASVDDLAVNRLLSAHGILYTDRAFSPGAGGVYTLDSDSLGSANAEHALRVLAGDVPGNVALAARVAREALAIVPLDSPLVAAADDLASRHAEALHAAYVSMAERPLRLAQHPLACTLLDLDARRATRGQVRAHPSASAFPGQVPADAPRLTRRITFDDVLPGWRSTGLYAAPGEVIHVRMIDAPAGSVNVAGAAVQIGAWLDPQRFDDRYRLPVAVFRVPITEEGHAAAASPIGGPVYLDLPAEVSRAGTLTVEISGAVEMPHYRHGTTDLAQWRDRLRHLPVAWAELESDELVFTIPADAVRDLDHPDLVMEHWKRVHDVMHSMEPRSPRHWPDRQYRYVAERRLSWGYMYCPADAPIVIPMTAARAMVDTANFDAEGPNELWGHYHEMGHAHQNRLWTFEGTGEVTVNIFTVLALNTVNGYPLDHAAMRTEPARALATMITHRKNGAPFDRWKADPFLALQTYALLWHTFGWDSFRETFRSYETMPESQRPRSDQEKRDVFVIQFGRTVGRNLGPYFAAWGVPLTERVEQTLSDLPAWMPEEPE
jgi:hypothetical protein